MPISESEIFRIVNNFRELNYIFDFKESEVLNSATMGNELRYLNHDSEIFNCKPESEFCSFQFCSNHRLHDVRCKPVIEVNGDLRIGIVSSMYFSFDT